MHLHKKLTEALNVETSTIKTYEGVDFGQRFFSFLDSLECNNLRNSSFSRKTTEDGILWDDNVARGGICMITETHPSVYHGKAGRMTVRGSALNLSKFEEHLKRFATFHNA